MKKTVKKERPTLEDRLIKQLSRLTITERVRIDKGVSKGGRLYAHIYIEYLKQPGEWAEMLVGTFTLKEAAREAAAWIREPSHRWMMVGK